jgi:hypothetical protein
MRFHYFDGNIFSKRHGSTDDCAENGKGRGDAAQVPHRAAEPQPSPLFSLLGTFSDLLLTTYSTGCSSIPRNSTPPPRSWETIRQYPLHVEARASSGQSHVRSPFERLGDTSKPRHVLCEGKLIPITESLFAAPIHLRSEHEERVFWADAICIEQAQIPTRIISWPLMGRISSEVAQTLIWLEEDSENSAEAEFGYFSKLYSYMTLDDRTGE